MKTYADSQPKLAGWSRWIAVFSLQLLVVGVAMQRLGVVETSAALNLLSLALLGGGAAIVLGAVAMVRIWILGADGSGKALTGIFLAVIMFAVPLWHLPALLSLPQINDISTDLQSPPEFQKLADIRRKSSRNVAYPGGLVAEAQGDFYPDIGPLTLERTKAEVFDLIREATQDLGWTIVFEEPPKKNRNIGWMEAVDHTLLMGFPDDIIVRVSGEGKQARIDMRSASRYGRHDLGRNARRITRLFSEIKTKLARAEADRADQVARARLAKRQKKQKLARLRVEREKQRKEDELRKSQEAAAPLPYGLRTTLGNAGRQPAGGLTGAGLPVPSAAQKESTRRRARRRRKKAWNPFRNTFFGD